MGSAHVLFVGGGDAALYELNADSGVVMWKSQIMDPATGGFAWTSPLLYNNALYMGVSSMADCPLIPGEILKVAPSSGLILGATHLAPNGCVGGGLWGSPSVDTTGTIFFANGTESGCPLTSPVLEQTVFALNSASLDIVGLWHLPESQKKTSDADFGSVPTVFDAAAPNTSGHLIAIANKNGMFYGFDRTNLGAGPVWSVQIAIPGATPQAGGGAIAPATYDGTRLYVAGGNLTVNGVLCQTAITAIDPPTGNIVWQHCYSGPLDGPVLGPVSEANGVVMICEGQSVTGVAASSGTLLFNFQNPATNGVFYGSPSISHGVVYAGDLLGNLYALSPGGV
jgi:outer membrane protein assembly factor BamB